MDLKDMFQNTKETIKRLVKPEMGELSHSGTDIWGIGNLPVYNPDDLAEKKGLEIYRTMQRRDGQVKAIFMLKKHARLSTPWSIRPEDEDDQDAVKQAEFIEHCFSDMKGNINIFYFYFSHNFYSLKIKSQTKKQELLFQSGPLEMELYNI